MAGEVGLYVRHNPDTIRAADIIFISSERYQRLSRPDGFLDVAPELVVEILSPNGYWVELNRKLREYFAAGVRLVWVVDPASRLVYAYRSTTDIREFTEAETLTGEDVLPGFSLPLAELFAD
ncbi:MAG: Uma2 family endonuclease [Anaerolineales bacterium]|nr:Uma2 family endonuclease [Anaerolineales bacterium]